MHGDFNKDMINDKIKTVRIAALSELKTAAVQMDCNAVIGLNFDYITIDEQLTGIAGNIIKTFLILTANGTAVTIEPA